MKAASTLACLATAILAACGGCLEDWKWPKPGSRAKDAAVPPEGPGALVYKDSIGEVAAYEGLRRMRVEGYGVVGGLGDKGSTECPREIRDRLVREMSKRAEFQRADLRRQGITPERIIDGPDTAVVLVQGEIPAAATAGNRFDVSVSAIPGTQTTSLRGGRLLDCDLNMVQMLTPTTGISGAALAEAQGPVFMNPFSDRPGAATKSTTRVGTIIGGGVVKTDRRVRVVLFRPSYSLAMRVASVINARYPQTRKIADAVSPSYVTLEVPPEFADDPAHFLAVVRQLYLSQEPDFAARRARELAEEIVKEGAACENIALAWEGLGKRVLPAISKLYAHEDQTVRYYAALAGLRLGDDVAVEVIAEHAANPQSPVRFAAIEELGLAVDLPRAIAPLRKLLDDGDNFVRAAAYEALLNQKATGIITRRIGRDNFLLDVVPSTGPRLIYAKRTGSRRIAVFGDGVKCQPPLVYRHPSGDLTINAHEADTQLTILRRRPYASTVGEPIKAGFDVPALIALLGGEPPVLRDSGPPGLSVDYATVIQALRELCELGSINATFLLEQKSVKELFGPSMPAGRPESELE